MWIKFRSFEVVGEREDNFPTVKVLAISLLTETANRYVYWILSTCSCMLMDSCSIITCQCCSHSTWDFVNKKAPRFWSFRRSHGDDGKRVTGDRKNIEVLEKPLKSCLRSGSKTPEVNSKGGWSKDGSWSVPNVIGLEFGRIIPKHWGTQLGIQINWQAVFCQKRTMRKEHERNLNRP